MASDSDLTTSVRHLARKNGFACVGIAPADTIPQAEAFRDWLAEGYGAGMDFLAANVEKRLCPTALLPGARSVICVAVGYAPAGAEPDTDAFVARYARGRNYHNVLKKRLHALADGLREIEPSFEGRCFVDTAPVAERSLAAAAGLGWIGRNGMLITPEGGSYVLLGEIVCNLPLPPDKPMESRCGECGACRTACPTDAIVADGVVDARRCISYHTIENRGPIPRDLWPAMNSCVFGCDACQAACPHNASAPPGDTELLAPPNATPPTLTEILQWNEDDWDHATRGTAMRRATRAMMLRNAVLAAGNSGRAELLPALTVLKTLRHDVGELADAIGWAEGRLSRKGD